MSPQQELISIIEKKETITEEKAFELFDACEGFDPDFITTGTWTGWAVETGHITTKWCEDVKFAGKKFNSVNDVQPVWVFEEDGARVPYAPSGTARLREVKYRGVVSTTLIYDGAPIMDYFRKVSDDIIISAADNKDKPPETSGGTFFFYLRRGEKA